MHYLSILNVEAGAPIRLQLDWQHANRRPINMEVIRAVTRVVERACLHSQVKRGRRVVRRRWRWRHWRVNDSTRGANAPLSNGCRSCL